MKKLFLITSGILLYNFLFWNGNLGLNLLIFSLFVCLNLFITKSKHNKEFYIALIGYIVSTSFVVIHYSTIALILSFLSLTLVIGLRDNQLKTIHYGILNSFIKYTQVIKFKSYLSNLNFHKSEKYKNYSRYLTLAIVPLLLIIVFLVLYINANPFFKDVYFNFIEQLAIPFQKLSFTRILFILWSITVIFWIVIKYSFQPLVTDDNNQNEIIQRIKSFKQTTTFTSIALKKEYITAIIFMVMINLLLLIVNIVDINWVWINFEYNFDFNISQFVHEGTYLLIFSVLLSIAILSFFYRKSLNFYKNNNLLKQLSYTWIIQNVVLVLSVGMRNMHYVEYFGLTNKRIGVFVFLLITSIGLITIALKIKYKYTFYHYFRVNSWAIYISLILCCIPNWDIIITKYNITQSENTHFPYLLRLSNKNLPILDQNRGLFCPYEEGILDEKIKKYISIQTTEETWLSWDYASYKTNEYFNIK